jgi:hydrogenase nickel incorporation protein HypB
VGVAHRSGHGHNHDHDHVHGHGHDHHHHGHDDHEQPAEKNRRIRELEHSLLARNATLAARNRQWLFRRGVVALNLIGAPGAGKTALLERTFTMLAPTTPMSVLEGDQATRHDAARLERVGARVIQINTGSGCHLTADMVHEHLARLDPPRGSLVAIENVGNLVCPSLFDLGEAAKVVVSSTTEGEEKPLKYPHVFEASAALVLTKADLIPYLDFDADRFLDNARRINPHLDVFVVSARTGEGLPAWCGWLAERLERRDSRESA